MSLNDSTEGRWLTPDTLGGDITNPQSLNLYAYALNNPTTLTDPSGLGPCNEFNTSYEGSGTPFPCNSCPSSGACGTSNNPSGPGPVTIDSNGDPLSVDIGEGEENYASNFGWLVQGSLYGHTIQPTFFSSLDAYFNWRTSLAALPQSQEYQDYLLDCQYATRPCTGVNDTVLRSRTGVTINAQLLGNPADVASLEAIGYEDPTTLFHKGDSSWYVGLIGLFGLGEGHVVADPNGIQDHYDDFGPLNPLHYLIQVPLGIFKTPPVPTTCSFVGGCL